MDDIEEEYSTTQALSYALRDLLNEQPFLASIGLQLEVCVNDDMPELTISTTGRELIINPTFFDALSRDGQVYALAHCLWHCALLHPWRRGNRDKARWDMACDIEVYNLLKNDGFEPPPCLENGLLGKLAAFMGGKSVEEIYDRLAANERLENLKSCIDQHLDEHPQPTSSSSSTELSESEKDDKGTGLDSASGDTADEASSLADVREVVCLVRNAVEGSGQLGRSGSGAGNVPGCVEELLGSLRPPSQNWRVLLGNYVQKCHAEQRRWYPSSRRHIWRGIYLPSIRSERLNAVVAIDTSGSTHAYVGRFFSEMLGIVRSVCSRYEITLIECDSKIQNVERLTEFSPTDAKRKWKVHGLGGTDFRPVFDYVEENSLIPDVMVFFTDGQGMAPSDAPGYPVVWCLPDDGSMDAPCGWGKEIRIQVDSLTL